MTNVLNPTVAGEPARPASWSAVLVKICSVVLELAGLMAMTADRILWKSYFADVTEFYRANISGPLGQVVMRVAQGMEVDPALIPPWFYDYLPIASVFTFGLLHGLAQVEGKNQLSFYASVAQDVYQALRKDFWGTFALLPLQLMVLLFFALTAPAFVIVFPCLVIAFFVGMIAFSVMMYGSFAVFIITRVLPLAALALVLVLGIWLFRSEATLYTALASFRRTTVHGFIRARRTARRKGPGVIRDEVTKIRDELKSGLKDYLAVIRVQYRIVTAIIFLFLTITSLNYAFL
jgi:hypothetical protein